MAASVSTNLDGTTHSSPGAPVTITFSRTDTPDPGDWVGIVDSSWALGYGRSFGYFASPPAASYFPYTSSGTDTPGSTGVASGSFSSVTEDPFGTGTYTCHAVYVDGLSGSLLVAGPTFTLVDGGGPPPSPYSAYQYVGDDGTTYQLAWLGAFETMTGVGLPAAAGTEPIFPALWTPRRAVLEDPSSGLRVPVACDTTTPLFLAALGGSYSVGGVTYTLVSQDGETRM